MLNPPRISLGGVEIGKLPYLPHIAIGAGVLVCAAIAYWVFSGKTPTHQAAGNSQTYSENSFCRVVSFNESAKNGTASPCLRCVTGSYTATTWTNCPVRESSEQPGSVECGYNAGQTPTVIDPASMCAQTEGSGQPASLDAEPPSNTGPIIANGEQPNSNDISGSNVPSGGIVITGPPRNVPNISGPSSGSNVPNGGIVITGPPRGVPNIPNTSGGSSNSTVVVTRVPSSQPPVGTFNPNFGASNGSSATTGGGFLAIKLPLGQYKPARVLSVTPGGAGAYWGMEPGDLIQSIQGSPVHYGQDVLDILAKFHPRDRVQIVVLRQGMTQSLDVVLGERPTANAGPAPSPGGAYPGGGPIELTGSSVQSELRDASGRLVREAAKVYVIGCNGQGFYIYEYLNRPGYRAIRPPDWSHSIGGRDFETYEDAVHVACE